MLSRKRVLIGTACLTAVVAFVLFYGRLEPRFQGRTISDWTYVYVTSEMDRDQKGQQRAEFAIRTIGTNGIPAIVTCLSEERGKNSYPVWLKMPILGDWLLEIQRNRNDKAFAAVHFFELLGPEGKSAIPQLMQMMDTTADFDVQHRAIASLIFIGDEALPKVATLLEPEHPACSVATALLSVKYYSRNITNGLVLVPSLVNLSTNANHKIAARAVGAIANLTDDPEIVFPIALQAFNSTNFIMRSAAVYAFGRLAQTEYVEGALSDPEEAVRHKATNVLHSIVRETK